jgi:hypothetical protein
MTGAEYHVPMVIALTPGANAAHMAQDCFGHSLQGSPAANPAMSAVTPKAEVNSER